MFEYQKRELSEEEYKMLIEELDEPEPKNREERRKQNKARKKKTGQSKNSRKRLEEQRTENPCVRQLDF